MTQNSNNSTVYCFRATGELRDALKSAFSAHTELSESDVIRLACAAGLSRIEQLDASFKRQCVENGITRGLSLLVNNIQELTLELTRRARDESKHT